MTTRLQHGGCISNWGQIGRLQVAATIAKSTCVDYTPKLKCTPARAIGTGKTARHETLAKAYSRPEVEGTAANYHGPLTLHQAAGVEVAEKVGPDAIVRKRLQ